MTDTVSIIITVLNGEQWIDSCFNSIIWQDIINLHPPLVKTEVCVFDDASIDKTLQMLNKWAKKIRNKGIEMKILQNPTDKQKGVGYGRNIAVKYSSGNYLCFQDIDDEMLPQRISEQYQIAKSHVNAIVGSKFIRCPENSTCRFSRWSNEITKENLETQIFTSNGPTVIMPTWFCHRKVFERVGGFNEDGHGTPEDLIFFYKHLDMGGNILRAESVLLIYRYHPEATTFSISQKTIWKIRLQRLMRDILSKPPWKNGFTIWNAGKQGRRFFRDLPTHLKDIVQMFCDVDKKKINKRYEYFDEVKRKATHSVPIVHFSNAKPPIIVCMKLFLTNGVFEGNLQSLNLTEGRDYVIFS